MSEKFTSADYLNYANAIAQYLTLADRIRDPDMKLSCIAAAKDILDILDPPKPQAKVLQLIHDKDNSNA